jgi:hypothetical protein
MHEDKRGGDEGARCGRPGGKLTRGVFSYDLPLVNKPRLQKQLGKEIEYRLGRGHH